MTTPTSNGLIAGELPVLTRKDFVSNQEVRWCPGCGDYSILAQMQKMLPELRIPRENVVFISGIAAPAAFRTTWRLTAFTASTGALSRSRVG